MTGCGIRYALVPKDRKEFAPLRNSRLKTARAWRLKETGMALFHDVFERLERNHLRWWHNWVVRQPVKTDDRSGANAEAALRDHHYLSAAASDERRQRVDQRQDSVGEVHGTRISEQAELRQRRLPPLWWS